MRLHKPWSTQTIVSGLSSVTDVTETSVISFQGAVLLLVQSEMGGSEKSLCLNKACRLSTESVEGSSLAFQGVDDIECGDGLSLGMLGVGDGITDDVFQENLEDTSGLFVDQAGDTLDTTSASQSSDGGLGDSLDVITKNLSVTLGASFSQSLSSFASS